MTTERRRIYQRNWQRKRRAKECTATARPTSGGGAEISLGRAGLEPGRTYLVSPRPGGAILLQPLRDDT